MIDDQCYDVREKLRSTARDQSEKEQTKCLNDHKFQANRTYYGYPSPGRSARLP